jgi:hypothetical protein
MFSRFGYPGERGVQKFQHSGKKKEKKKKKKWRGVEPEWLCEMFPDVSM